MSMGALGLQHDMDGLAAEDVRRLSDFIYQYSGIKMPPAKKTMLEGRLRKRLSRSRLRDDRRILHLHL